MHFSALRGINRTACGTKLLLTAVLAHPVVYQFMPHTKFESTALLFEFEWLLWLLTSYIIMQSVIFYPVTEKTYLNVQ